MPLCATCGCDVDTARFNEKQKKCKDCVSKEAKLKIYGLTYEKWMEMVLGQQNCAICYDEFDLGDTTSFHVDHNHSTGEVRAILCRSCNVALGHIKEREYVAQNMALYINNWKKQLETIPR